MHPSLTKIILKFCGTILLVSALTIVAPVVKAQTSPEPTIPAEKKALIEEMLTVMKVKEMINQAIIAELEKLEKELPQLMDSFSTNLPASKRSEFDVKKQEISKRMVTRLRESLLENAGNYFEEITGQVYAKYLDEEEIKALITFYRTTSGQKIISVMPQMYQEIESSFAKKMSNQMMAAMLEIVAEEMRKYTP